ncbi:kinetochore-associated Ndc80 complex subunit spc25 [Coemansia erecta]|uniref:Kinetochore protein SPC25 n=1 Tax=Coemansia asiatica TaxID=1052880 RepID=A0A9W7XJN3_9FUNG|nr:kinetochore-associated Ndc80 complex subunit spc25 [Coemansia asiatica]KAJ2855284.1 kinetochore-associated Ndc80 complex subunit spc25 [Coemansia erecta]KAJ2889050.1 kinetochore-associated Ndc80 complex subunit spc25 [Coemansia asiatica]
MSTPGYQGLSTPRRRPMTPGRRDHILPSFNSPASVKIGRLLDTTYSDATGGVLAFDEELPGHVADRLASAAVISTSEEYEAPRVWFQKDEDRRQNSEFTRRVDEMVQELKRLVRERASDFEHQMEEGREREKRMVVDMDALEKENKEILSALKDEHGEEEELSRDISGLQVKQRDIKDEVNQLSSQLARLETELAKRRKAIDEKLEVLEAQRAKNQPELEFFKNKMGLSIAKGDSKDSLTFIFTLISLSEPARPFAITVDMSQRDYQVTKCSPEIKELDKYVETLNASRDFFEFLKRIRKAFVSQYFDSS